MAFLSLTLGTTLSLRILQSKNLLDRFFVLEKRAVLIVWGLGPRDSCSERFRSDGVLTLPCLLMYHSILFVTLCL